MKTIHLSDIQKALAVIKDDIERTAVSYSNNCSKEVGSEIYLKYENHQRTGSFKVRGALNKIRSLSDQEKKQGVVTASAGNHAQGVALACQILKIKCKVVMPKSTPLVKIQATHSYEGEVVLHGEVYDDSYKYALELAEKENMTFVHPYDDPYVMAGQGTIGLELHEDIPDLDSVLVSLGGGGLISGVALALKSLNPNCKIIGVTPENAPAMERLYNKSDRPFTFKPSIADGTTIKNPNQNIYEDYITRYVDEIVTVSEDEIAEAVVFLLERAKTVVEGSGALGLAAAMHRKLELGKKSAIILCGGNIDLNLMNKAIDRGLAKAGRIARIHVLTSDKPGELNRLTKVIASQGANILEVQHDRLSSVLSIRETEISFLVEARDHKQIMDILAALSEAGVRVKF